MCIDQIISLLKDLTQIAFWVIAALIAWLSYRQAKKSIFQPAKNEVFKVQIDALQSLLTKLNWKSSIEAWSASGLKSSFQITLNGAFKSYAKDKFNVDIKSKFEEHLVPIGAIVSRDAKGFQLIKGPADEAEDEDDFGQKAFSWECYTWETFQFGTQFEQVGDLIQHVLNDPVLPLTIISKVEHLNEELHQSAIRAAEDIQKAAREFPRHYPTTESLKGANLIWVHNMREERGEGLFKALEELKKAIRNYLNSDKLLDNN